MLAYLEGKVEETIDREIRGELVPADLPERQMFGVVMSSEAAKADYRQVCVDAAASYHRHADELRHMLREAGIKPIAIVPRQVWTRICRLYGLFIMRPDSSGRINLSSDAPIREFMERWESGFALPGWAGSAVLTLLSLFVLMTPTEYPAIPIILMWSIFCGWMAAAYYRHSFRHWISTRSWHDILTAFSLDDEDRGMVLGFTGYSGVFSSGPSVNLRLPVAPLSVVDVLKRMRSVHLKGVGLNWIAADAGSISFKESLVEIFDVGMQQLRIERARARDPIVFCSWYDCVAILAAYGDSPIERASVDELVESGCLL